MKPAKFDEKRGRNGRRRRPFFAWHSSVMRAALWPTRARILLRLYSIFGLRANLLLKRCVTYSSVLAIHTIDIIAPRLNKLLRPTDESPPILLRQLIALLFVRNHIKSCGRRRIVGIGLFCDYYCGYCCRPAAYDSSLVTLSVRAYT